MQIYQDDNGVNAFTFEGAGDEGHLYRVVAGPVDLTLKFQQGGVATAGVNGITSEVLLAVLIDRTKHLDSKFPCIENREALLRLEKALMWFNTRTANRQKRGVEGQEVV